MPYISKFQDSKETVLILCKADDRSKAVDQCFKCLDEEGKKDFMIQVADKISPEESKVFEKYANTLGLYVID